ASAACRCLESTVRVCNAFQCAQCAAFQTNCKTDRWVAPLNANPDVATHLPQPERRNSRGSCQPTPNPSRLGRAKLAVLPAPVQPGPDRAAQRLLRPGRSPPVPPFRGNSTEEGDTFTCSLGLYPVVVRSRSGSGTQVTNAAS